MNTLLTLHDPARAREYYVNGHWRDPTMHSLAAEHAAARPGQFALRDGKHRLCWRDLVAWADGVADDLHEAGVRRGERVAVWVPSRVEAVVTLLACSRNGYVCIPSLHQNYTVAEVLQLLGAAHCSALIAQSGYGAGAAGNDAFAAAAALRSLRRVYGVEPRGGAAAATRAARAVPGLV